MRPQAHIQAQAKDRVLQRRTTLRDEEPDKTRIVHLTEGFDYLGFNVRLWRAKTR